MTLENKLVENYFNNPVEDISKENNPKLWAEVHLDSPLGSKIKGLPGCKICKGEGYIKCRSGKHERACRKCLELYMALKNLPA